MAKRTVVVMPGDGIGKVVLPEALRVLEAAGFAASWVEAGIGWEHWVAEGNPLPPRTVDLIAEHKVALFGAITSKPKERAAAELRPELHGRGLS
jgi:3-isopropylmalate dehydrogenase